MKRILVIGSANIDFVFATRRLPKPGETVSGEDIATYFGGKGANQAVAAQRLGGEVEFVGSLGADAHADSYKEHLRREGIEIGLTVCSKTRPTGCAGITVDEAGSNMIVVSPGANSEALPEKIPGLRTAIDRADIILLQCEIPAATNAFIIQQANVAGKSVILNPSPIGEGLSLNGGQVDFVVLNELELGVLSKKDNLVDNDDCLKAARDLLPQGYKNVIVTRGELSTLVLGPDHEFHFIPTFDVEPIDTVAAGDTFAGALAVGLANGSPIKDAVKFANAAAALATLKKGAQSSIPSRADVEEFL